MNIQDLKDNVFVPKKDVDKILKDRLDFGFDSIYFRYAEVCDELTLYKVMYEHLTPHEAKMQANNKKMHFYNTLEQLVQAHQEEKQWY